LLDSKTNTMKKTTVFALLFLFLACPLWGQTKTKKSSPPKIVPNNYSFFFNYYQVYADKKFDSLRLWNGCKLRKTFNNKGSITHSLVRESLSWKLKGEDDKDVLHIFKQIDKDRLITIGGVLYFRYEDEKLGPSVAIFHPDKKIWVIYRKNQPPKTT